jgi:hypothetical protein
VRSVDLIDVHTLPQVLHLVMVDLYSFRVPPESFLAVRYFAEAASRLIDMVTTPIAEHPVTLGNR